MLDLHAGTGAHDDLGVRFVECFVQAADDAGLPDDPEFRASLRAYMEWGVQDVLASAPHGTAVPRNLAMPRWSWDGLQEDAVSRRG